MKYTMLLLYFYKKQNDIFSCSIRTDRGQQQRSRCCHVDLRDRQNVDVEEEHEQEHDFYGSFIRRGGCILLVRP